VTRDDTEIVSVLRGALADKVGKERFELWFGASTRLELDGATLTVGAPSRFFTDWLRNNFRQEIETACVDTLGIRPDVKFCVDATLPAPQPAPLRSKESTAPALPPAPQPAREPAEADRNGSPIRRRSPRVRDRDDGGVRRVPRPGLLIPSRRGTRPTTRRSSDGTRSTPAYPPR
jgi:hypothetical protein